MKEELKKYEVKPDAIWAASYFYDGYEMMGLAAKKGWHSLGVWGRDGWDLGRWPYVVVFLKEREGYYGIVINVEGDITQYETPTEELRNAIVDNIAFFYWKYYKVVCVENYNSVDELPEELRGSYRS